jgi:hypothetical protein
MISVDNKSYSSSSGRFIYKDFECSLDGFHNDFNHRNELCLTCLNDEWKSLEWIKVSSKVILDDKVYFIQTRNKFEQNKDILQELIDICDEGIKNNRKLFWVFSN